MSVLEIILLCLMGIGVIIFITIGLIKTFKKKKTKEEDNEEIRL